MVSLLVALTLFAAAPESPLPPRAVGTTHVLGHYDLTHAERLASLFAFDGHVLHALDVRGQSLGWNLDSSLPVGAFAGATCLLQPPLAQTPALDLVAGVSPGGTFEVCEADGKRTDVAPPQPAGGEGGAHPTALAVRRDAGGRLLFVWGDATGALSSWREGEPAIAHAKTPASVLALTLLPSGEALVLSADGKLGRWNGHDALKGGARLTPPSCGLEMEPCPRGEVRIVSGTFAPDGAWALVSYATPGFQGYGVGDARTQRFELGGHEPHLVWDLRGVLTTAALALPGSALVAAISTSTPPDIEGPVRVERWTVSSTKPQERMAPASPVLSVAFSPDGQRVAAGHADGTLELWDAGTDRTLAHVALKAGPLISLAYSPDGKTLAVQPQDGPARLLSPETGQVKGVLHALAAHAERGSATCRDPGVSVADDGDAGGRELAFSPDGSELLASYAEASCASFDPCAPCPEAYTPARVRVSDGTLLERWEKADQPLFTRCSVALGVPILPMEKGGAGAWSTDGKAIGRLGLPDVPVTRCATGGKWVALLSARGLQLQARPSGAPRLLPLPGKLGSLAVSGDGHYVLVGSDQEVRLLGLPKGQRLQVLPLGQSQDAPRALAFSPHGDRMAVGTQRGVVLLLDNPAAAY